MKLQFDYPDFIKALKVIWLAVLINFRFCPNLAIKIPERLMK